MLLPLSWSAIRDARGGANKTPPPCAGWNEKDATVKAAGRRGFKLRKRHAFLLVGWGILGYTMYQASFYQLQAALYDPFKILGIATVSHAHHFILLYTDGWFSELDREANQVPLPQDDPQVVSSTSDSFDTFAHIALRFSRQSHPDKVKLAENQTMEEVESYFVELTKAYKSLTDETIRRNYELYGHPDGKQEFGMGIAIPKSFIEAQNNIYTLGFYAFLFGIVLPYSVGRWWFRSREFTKDGILNDTAAKFFLNIKEDSSFADAVQVLAMASEFERLLESHDKVVKSRSFDKLQNMVKKQLADQGAQMDGELYKRYKTCQRAGILLYAHLLRVPIEDRQLARCLFCPT